MFPKVFNLTSLNGTNGFAFSAFGYHGGAKKAIGIGDFNGDGIDDFVVMNNQLQYQTTIYAGGLYVVFGSACGFNNPFDFTSVNGTNGFIIVDPTNYITSFDVLAAGDVNGDAIPDIIVIPGINLFGQGLPSSVVFGSRNGFAQFFDLADIDGTNGFNFQSSTIVASVGDVNGDGINDIAVSTCTEVNIIFGHRGSFSTNFNDSILDRSNGFVIINSNEGGECPTIKGIGDVNADGIRDVGLSWGWNSNLDSSYPNYIVYGTRNKQSNEIDVNKLNGKDGFIIDWRGVAILNADRLSISAAGDVNADGVDDMIMTGIYTDYNDNYQEQRSCIIFGNENGFPALLNSTSPMLKFLLFSNIQESAHYRWELPYAGSVGDVNADGINDVAVGSDESGYIIFGSSGFSNVVFDLNNLDGNNGFIINDTIVVNKTVLNSQYVNIMPAGDINADGIDDVIISDGGQQGYVIFGKGAVENHNIVPAYCNHTNPNNGGSSSNHSHSSESSSSDSHHPADVAAGFSTADLVGAAIGSAAGAVLLTGLSVYLYNRYWGGHNHAGQEGVLLGDYHHVGDGQ